MFTVCVRPFVPVNAVPYDYFKKSVPHIVHPVLSSAKLKFYKKTRVDKSNASPFQTVFQISFDSDNSLDLVDERS